MEGTGILGGGSCATDETAKNKNPARDARAKERPTLRKNREGWGTQEREEKKDPPFATSIEKGAKDGAPNNLEDESVAGGVVAGFGVDVERRKAPWGAQLDLDFAPAGVMNFVTRPISQNILVSQLHANF